MTLRVIWELQAWLGSSEGRAHEDGAEGPVVTERASRGTRARNLRGKVSQPVTQIPQLSHKAHTRRNPAVGLLVVWLRGRRCDSH